MRKIIVAAAVLIVGASTAVAGTLSVKVEDPLKLSVEVQEPQSIVVTWYHDLTQAENAQAGVVACGYEDVSLKSEDIEGDTVHFVMVTHMAADKQCVSDALG